MLSNEGHQDTRATLFQYRQRPRLVLLYQPAVTDDIGGEDGGKAALDRFYGHRCHDLLEAILQIVVDSPPWVYRVGTSAMGQSRRFRDVCHRSAHPPTADTP